MPRPDAWAKAQLAPACFLLAASATGDFRGWARFGVLWLILDGLIYPARYQWNDIRGADSDQRHAESLARSRLPHDGTARALRLSWLTAAARVLAALLIGLLAGLPGQAAVLTAAVGVTAVAYEFLRAAPRGSRPGTRAVAIWLAVGLGYVVRSGLGLRLGGLAWGSKAMLAMLACAAAFGIMFVLLTWALEATSYCVADAGGGWHARPELGSKPHIAALLPSLDVPLSSFPLGSSAPDHGRYCGDQRVLRGAGRLPAPWNLALAAGAGFGAAGGAALAGPAAAAAAWSLAAAAMGLAGAVLLARCGRSGQRWLTAVAWALVLTGAAAAAHAARPVLAGLPWLGVAVVYTVFRACSYRDLIRARPGLRAGPRTSSTPRLPAQKDGTGLSLAVGQPRPGPP